MLKILLSAALIGIPAALTVPVAAFAQDASASADAAPAQDGLAQSPRPPQNPNDEAPVETTGAIDTPESAAQPEPEVLPVADTGTEAATETAEQPADASDADAADDATSDQPQGTDTAATDADALPAEQTTETGEPITDPRNDPNAQEPAPQAPPRFFPALYDVNGLKTWDTLNVRETPDGRGKVIGTLPATQKSVEVLFADRTGQWGRVNLRDRSGWVALRFMQPRQSIWQPARLPQSMVCRGVEPFWALKTLERGMEFSTPETEDRRFEIRRVLDRGIENEATRGLILGDGMRRITAFIQPAQCWDGMSERAYGLSTSLIIEGENMPTQMLTGCCSVQP